MRYQLDPSSNSASTDESCVGCGAMPPATFAGEVWLEFKRESSGYQIEMWTYLRQPTQTTGSWTPWRPSLSTSQLPAGQMGVQMLPHVFSVPQPEGSFMAQFNLAFLELNWNNGAYELATSLIGFDKPLSRRLRLFVPQHVDGFQSRTGATAVGGVAVRHGARRAGAGAAAINRRGGGITR